MTITERAERLAANLLADRQRERPKHNIVPCWSCGQTFVYRGRLDELNGNFCSTRCHAWFDGGAPSYERQCEHERKLLKYPLADLVVIAGPPGTAGRKPYAELFAAGAETRRERKRRRRKAA
jgi:hypothetical protein